MDDTSSDHAASEGERVRPDSTEEEYEHKRRRVDGVEPGFESPKVKAIEDDLLSILEDSDDSSDGDPLIHALDSVIKSFEEEIVVPGRHPSPIVLDPTPKGSPIELGYLLEASDDELGLPPTFANYAEESSGHEVPELPDVSSSVPFVTPFDGEMPNYDHFDLGPEINTNNMIGKEGNEEFLMLGGLFDFQENWYAAEVMWRPESLPAV